jgi:hypothetical protein
MDLLSPLDEKIIVWGQSCVGKTHFSQQLDRPYLCFDALFRWHEIETLGFSPTKNLEYISSLMTGPCVLDGWHLSDPHGGLMPRDAVVYILYAPYRQIIEQYRVPVREYYEHHMMFHRWYKIEPTAFQNKLRYVRNTVGSFIETTYEQFSAFMLSEECSR